MLAAPHRSLLLTKSAGVVPHGGGVKIPEDGSWYRLIERWIAEGAHDITDNGPQTVRIEVEPSEVVMAASRTQQLKVVAIDSAGNVAAVG